MQYSQAQRYSFRTYYMKMIIKWDHNYICFEKTCHLHCLIAVNTRNISEPYPVITGSITHWMNSPVSNQPRPPNRSKELELSHSFTLQRVYPITADVRRILFTNTGEKVPEFARKTIDTVVHRSSSDLLLFVIIIIIIIIIIILLLSL